MRSTLAILTLALGISAATAMFSFVHPMLLHPFLYPRADRLVVIEARDANDRPAGISWPEFQDYRKSAALADAAAFDIGFFFLTGVDEPEQIAGALVTTNLPGMLGEAPALGRAFREGEDGVVILSDACWRKRFGADPNILGRNIALDFARTPETERYTVIGVMPRDFWMYYREFEVFVPLPRAAMNEDRRARGLAMIGRLKDGATLQQARSALAAIPEEKGFSTAVRLWEQSETQDVRPGFLVLAAGAALLLLIATANAAGLLLVRGEARRREIAIRAALGASPWRLWRLLIGESLRAGALAGVLGTLLAWWGLRIMVASLPRGGLLSFLPSLDRVVIDFAALGFAVCASAVACVIAGLFPAMAAGRIELVTALKDGTAIDSPATRTVLVTAEIALSVTLLAGAGLLVKTMARIDAIDPGFRADHLLTLRVPLPRATDRNHAEAYYRELESRIGKLPGVRSAALASAQPLTGAHRTEQLEIPGRAEPVSAEYRVVSPAYFWTLGIAIRRGRAFEARDDHRVVIGEALARKYWAGEDPIGKWIRVRGETLEIIGVCADTRDALLRDPAPLLYRAWRDEPDRAQQLDVRSWQDPIALAHAVNGVVRELGGVVAEEHRGDDLVQDATWQQRQSARVLGAFAGLALGLAGIGLYGVIAIAVGRRRREIGIRVAIGARRVDVAGLVLRESARPLLVGLAIGLAAALGMSHWIASVLYGEAASDPWVLASVAGVVAGAAMIASAVPLARALRVDPVVALRCE